MPTFEHDSMTLSYEVLGDPQAPTVVFLHGLLLASEMMAPLARAFTDRFRTVNLELHGHGKSSKPREAGAYSMSAFAGDVVALADHLECERVAVFGTSLGADVALEAMLDHPERIAGAVLEMPVLDVGAKVARRVFAPVARALRSRRAPATLRVVARRIPSWPSGFPEAAAMLAEDPVAGAAVIDGLLAEAERDRWQEVRACGVPAMVIGHRFDPLHAFRDAARLADALPAGRLVRAKSILELRLRPGRILGEAMSFCEWALGPESERGAAS